MNAIVEKVLRRVRLLPGDPGRADRSKTTILGVSLAYLSVLAGVEKTTLQARASEYRTAIREGRTPPPESVNLEDWWDLARWVLEHRLAARLEADGIQQYEARRRAALAVSQMLAPIRELFR
jgi:hypothetical protein